MSALERLLVPTDFGEAAACALDLALTIAVKFGSTVILLHAYDLLVPTYAEGLGWPILDVERLARKELDAARVKAQSLYPAVEAVLVCGDPVRGILETAEKHNADMIVMGTHGRRGLSRLILGSVAGKIVRLSPIPVVTVSAEEPRAPRGHSSG